MINKDILGIAMKQSAEDIGCKAEDFLKSENVTVPFHLGKNARKYYKEPWSNALCEDRKELDVLGVGAYDGDKLVGLAGCSADCEDMWQIGVDVLPDYRRRGIASGLTSRLAKEIINRGKVPFYCSAWSNIRSVRNAVKSGFIPAWVEMTAKPSHIVDDMNKTDVGPIAGWPSHQNIDERRKSRG